MLWAQSTTEDYIRAHTHTHTHEHTHTNIHTNTHTHTQTTPRDINQTVMIHKKKPWCGERCPPTPPSGTICCHGGAKTRSPLMERNCRTATICWGFQSSLSQAGAVCPLRVDDEWVQDVRRTAIFLVSSCSYRGLGISTDRTEHRHPM